MFSWFKKKAVVIRQAPPPSVISSVADDEIPRYPPFMKGLPVVPPERLLNTQKELLEHIANTAIATPEILKRYYIPALQRFASFAHLLPASQSHHHRGAGGLLRHSMEVALWALQSADKVLLDSARTPALRREMEPRWQLAVFLAGLCHDAGKPVTDVTVSNRERSAVWKPIKEDLYEWASRNQVSAYFLEWREGRARQHTVLSNLIADRMIGAGMLEWIEEGGTELIVWLMESLADNPGPGNRLHDLVIKADQASVERDLKTLGVAMAGYELGVPVERHLTDVMRRFIQEGRWLVNEPGARLWHIDGGIYLVWPAAGEEIARQVSEDGIPGIPRTPDGILDMLLERKMASIREDASPENRLWKIAPAVLTEKIPDLKLPAIRLRDDTLVSSVPIPAVAGKILKENEEAKTDEAVTAVSGQKDSMPPGAESGTPQTFQEPVEAKVSPVISTPIEQPPAPQEKPVVKEKSVPKGITGAASDHAYTSNPDISLEGPVGEALKALAQDLKLGDKVWGNDVVLDSEQQVLLRWPTAFSGYGLTPKAILAELSEKTWLWIDPLAPLKKVLDREVAGVLGKFIRLKHDVSTVFVCEASGKTGDKPGPVTGESSKKTSSMNDVQAVAECKVIDLPLPQDQQQAKPDLEGQKKNEVAKAHPDLSSCDGEERAVPPNVTGPSTTFQASGIEPSLSPETLLALLRQLNRAPEQDGWITYDRQEIIRACKLQGLKITHGQLNTLAKNSHGKLVITGSKVKCKDGGRRVRNSQCQAFTS